MGRSDGENASADGDRHREAKRQRTSRSRRPARGPSLARSNTAASIAPATANTRTRPRAWTRSTTRRNSAESGAGNHRSPCHRRWRPWLAASLLPRSCAQRSAWPQIRRRHPGSRTGRAATQSPRRSHRQRPEAGRPQQRCRPLLGQPPPEHRCRWPPVPSPDRPRGRLPTAPQGGSSPGREEPSRTPAPARRRR